MHSNGKNIEQIIVEQALAFGASLAGIASIKDLQASPSFEIYGDKPYYEEYDPSSSDYHQFKGFNWRPEHKSVLVLALAHPASEPILDWWSLKVKGFTPGNGILRTQARKMRLWMEQELGIKAFSLPYQIEYGGTFLKDSAHLAGLGVIGKNNLLVTPEFGTRVRLRGSFIEAELEPTGPLDFDPCNGCPRPCHSACPRDAFRSASFERPLCKAENDERYANEELMDGSVFGIQEASMVMQPCRFCELACPVAQGSAVAA
jgi:epoxyqueuosine reductase